MPAKAYPYTSSDEPIQRMIEAIMAMAENENNLTLLNELNQALQQYLHASDGIIPKTSQLATMSDYIDLAERGTHDSEVKPEQIGELKRRTLGL